MRVPSRTGSLVGGTVTAGIAIAAAALLSLPDAPLRTLALLGAAVLLTELIQVPRDESSPDPADAHSFSFSFGVHIAAVLLLGPWPAVLVAVFGVIVVDGLRGSPWRHIAYNASVFALAVLAGGQAFLAAGGVPAGLEYPADFPALAALLVTAYLVQTILMTTVVAFEAASPAWALGRVAMVDGLPSAAAEAGLGIVLAHFVRHEPWAVVALAPLLLAVYFSHARLAALRRETAHALETFANVIDERDRSTFRHSARVAAYVERLAVSLGVPALEVARLRWAGRLHDLGKVGVDAAVLRKPGRLDDEEWAAMRRHPRLSARLLRHFRFAAEEARAVEYHHERQDGEGYYGIESSEIPLAAHFLIVADSYDAMTSDRAYRRGLPKERALEEIEANVGKQFHPLVARAFVALERGLDPRAELTREELVTLTRPSRKRVHRVREVRADYVAAFGLIGALVAVGAGVPAVALPALAVGVFALVLHRVESHRARRLRSRLLATARGTTSSSTTFACVATVLSSVCDLRWAGLVAWREREGDGSVELEWSAGERAPRESALMSWLFREVESVSGLSVAVGGELGQGGTHVAVPLCHGDTVAGYLVLALPGRVPRRVTVALNACADELARILPVTHAAEAARPRLRAIGL
jgi:putative nucleotidyltransferase with HDIG domain